MPSHNSCRGLNSSDAIRKTKENARQDVPHSAVGTMISKRKSCRLLEHDDLSFREGTSMIVWNVYEAR